MGVGQDSKKIPPKEQGGKQNKFMLIGLLRMLARLPLSWLQAVGSVLGWISYLVSSAYAGRLRENLAQSRLWRDEQHFGRLLHANVSESGKAITELIAVWFRPLEDATRLAVSIEPLALMEEAERRGRGIIYLTPHLGCPDIAAAVAGLRRPITALYRPPRMKSLQPLIEAGRARGGVSLAPADLSGVRRLFKALKRGEAVGILPDQAPSEGEGAWSDFFGRPAYTMTLVGRLAEATGATVLMAFAERLPNGSGYAIHVATVDEPLGGADGMRNLNAAVEKMIARRPEQYLWAYNRYKVPAGAHAPPTKEQGPGTAGRTP